MRAVPLIALLAGLAAAAPLPAAGAEAATPPAAAPPVDARVECLRPVPAPLAAATAAALGLGRSLGLWGLASPVVALLPLAGVDPALLAASDAERAALLAALAAAEAGDGAALAALAARPAGEAAAALRALALLAERGADWRPGDPPLLAALAIERALAQAESTAPAPRAEALARGQALLAAARAQLPEALRLQFAARLAGAASEGEGEGENALSHWQALAALAPTQDWERDLVADAALHAFPARPLGALQTPPAATDGNALLAARLLLDEQRAEEAWSLLVAIEALRQRERAQLAALDPAAAADSLLALARPGGLALADAPRAALTAAIARAAADRRESLATAGRAEGARLLLVPTARPRLELAPALHDSLAAAGDALGAARWSAAEAAAALAAHEADRAARRRHLDAEAARLAALRAALAASAAPIDSLSAAALSREADLVEFIAAYREALLGRAARLARRAALQAAAQRALVHLRLDGPRARRAHSGLDADSVLIADGGLAAELARFGDDYAAWLPGELAALLAAGSARLASWPAEARAAYAAQLAEAQAIEARLAAWRGASDPQGEALAAALDRARRAAAAAATQVAAQRARAAAWLIAERLAQLDREQELLDYQLAEAALERAETLTAAVTTGVGAAADEARARCERFLAAHPQSAARGELRFQLAELQLHEARTAFAARMAAFLGAAGAADAAAARALAPFLDVEPACALYRAILAEDPDYPGRAAVRFNLGMLLDEQGDPEGERQLELLLAEHPAAPELPQAQLRLAERALLRDEHARAARHYEAVAAEGSPELARVALYTLGWLYYNEDRFLDAAERYRRLIDLEATAAVAGAAEASLAREAEGHLAECLARAGGAPAWDRFFAGEGARAYAPALLAGVAGLMRSYGFHGEAAAADSLWIARQPLAPDALAQGRLLLADRRAAGDSTRVEAELGALAARFRPGSEWQADRSAGEDSLAQAASDFARGCLIERGTLTLARARAGEAHGDWQDARASLELLLAHWPRDLERSRRQLAAGEAAARLGDSEAALAHYAGAAEDPALAALADWQALALLDALQGAALGEAAAPARARFLAAGDRYLDRHSQDSRAPALLWRLAGLRDVGAQHAEAAADFARFARRWPQHAAAPLAAARSGDALSRGGDAAAAALRYEEALALARAAGADSLAAAMQQRVPESHFLAAATAMAADSSDCAGARRFADLAAAWPSHARADEACYRAGLGFAACGEREAAAAAFTTLAERYPASGLAGDARLQTAALFVKLAPPRAAAALAAYAAEARTPEALAQAPDALLHAIDLAAVAGGDAQAERYRDDFLARFPAHPAALTEILHARALAALDARGDVPLADARALGGPVAAYLAGVAAQPALADADLLARVDYLACLAIHRDFAALALAEPLESSLERKQARLAALAEQSQRVLAHGSRRWSRAAAHLLGASLYEFGDALLAVEPPAALGGDDRLAYLEVLENRAWELHARGEQTWSELVRLADPADGDPDNWVAITKNELWPRIARRFLHLPELEFPLVAAVDAPAAP